MGLKNMSIATGATISVTGGTAVVFADDGVTIPNGIHLVVPAILTMQLADLRQLSIVRRSLTSWESIVETRNTSRSLLL